MSRSSSFSQTHPRRGIGALTALLLIVVPGWVQARALTTITELAVSERGDSTVIQLRAAAKPMFSVFKLDRPARLTVDIANGEYRGVPGLLDVDTWAVSQVATAAFQTTAARIARLMINFRRPGHYTVRTEGSTLVVTIVPDQARPKTDPVRLSREAEDAKREASRAVEEARRQVAESQKKSKLGEQALEQARAAGAKAQSEAVEARRVAEKERSEARAARLSAEREQKESAAAKAQLDEERKQAAAAKAQAAAARAEAESVKRQAIASREEALAQKKAAATKSAALQQALANLERNDRERKSAQREARRHEQVLAEAQRHLSQREVMVQKLQREMEQARQTAQNDAAGRHADVTAAQQRVRQIEARLAQAAVQLKQAQAARSRTETKLSDAEQRRQRAEAAFINARHSQQQAEQARLSAEGALRSAEARRLAAEQRLAQEESRRREADRARGEAETRAEQLSRAREEVRARKAKLDELSGKVQSLEEQLARAQTREREQRQALAGAQQETEASRALTRQAQAATRELGRAVASERARSEALLREVGRVRAELERQRSLAAAAVAEVERLQRGVQEAKARLARQTDEPGRKVAKAELQRAEQRLQQAEQARLAAERGRANLLEDIKRREGQQQVAAAALRGAEQRLQLARGRAQSTERQLADAERRLAADQRELARTVAQRQTEEGRRQQAERARRSEEERFGDAESKRRTAEAARASAERRLTEVQAALAKARQDRLAEEKALADLRRAQERATQEVKRALRERSRGNAASTQWAAKEKASTKAKAPPAVVKDIRYVDGDRTAQIHILTEGSPAPRLGREGRFPVLSLDGIVVPKLLQRTLDVTEFGGPVSQITSFVPDPAQSSAVIKVSLRDPGTPGSLRQEGDRLVWEFRKSQIAKASPLAAGGDGAADEAVSFSSPRVAGVQVRRVREQRRYTGRRIDLDFKDADIHNILRLLSEVGNVNIVTADNVGGRVTIRMRNVPWDQALDVILRAKGLGQVREGNLLRVAPATDLEKEREAEIARVKQVALLKPLETRLIPLSYARAQKMLPQLRYSLSPRGALTFDDRTNMVIARDIAGNLDLMERMIRNLDTQTPQVLIEARIVEARTNFTKEVGIQWGGFFSASPATGNATGLVFPSTLGIGGGATDGNAPVAGLIPTPANPAFAVNLPAATGTGKGGAIGLTLGNVSGSVNINLRLSAAEATGDIRIVSAPKITTLDNVEAKIEQGVTIPFSQVSAAGVQTTFMDAKLNLTVRPHVTADGSVIMNVEVTRNEPDFANTGARGEPTILKKEAKTEMLVKDGDTAVIGGIYTTRTGQRFSKVPWFADIPVIGYLFRSRTDTSDREEVLVFITPRIINRAQSIGQR